MWIDAHNHLQDPALRPALPEIIATLRQLGLQHAVVNGTTETDWADVQHLAGLHPWILPSYGLHPWFIQDRTPDWQSRLLEKIRQTPGSPCAIGEIGLDRWIQGHDLQDQREIFTWQLRLAAEHHLPVTIHCIQAWGALAEILQTGPLPARGFLLHSYGGPAEMTALFARLGARFSFSGWFLQQRKQERRDLFRQLPLDRILVETDAPAMPLPVDRQAFSLPGEANHPANIATVYHELAALRQMPVAELAGQVAENFHRLFLA